MPHFRARRDKNKKNLPMEFQDPISYSKTYAHMLIVIALRVIRIVVVFGHNSLPRRWIYRSLPELSKPSKT